MSIESKGDGQQPSGGHTGRETIGRAGGTILLGILPLAYLWFQLVNSLWLEWDTNPQYSYGLVVPLLIIGLLLRRWLHFPACHSAAVAESPFPVLLLGALFAFLYLPVHLVSETIPEWRPLQWVQSMVVIGLTLCLAYLGGGKNWFKLVAFPVAFFAVAIPWPSPVEQPVIQGLSRLNASLVVEVLGVIGYPAIQHGNVIEVSTGMVGINDACSGIRSFQSSLMISLFLGEFFMFTWRRRLWLVPISFALAMILNLCRASLLTWIAAKDGVSAIAKYHDEAGFTILLACTALLWGAAWLMHRFQRKPAMSDSTATPKPPANSGLRPAGMLKPVSLALLVWLVVVEAGVQIWYHVREAQVIIGPSWTVNYPVNDPTFKELPFTTEERQLLQFDEGKNGQWQTADGHNWQSFYFEWRPGRVAGYLAKRHTPDVCLTASGLQLLSGPELMVENVDGVDLPFRHYVFRSSEGVVQVYQCHWEAGLDKRYFTADESSRMNLIRGVWAGRGNKGQKVLELILWGYDNADLAKKAFEAGLKTLIKVEPSEEGAK